MPIGSDVKRLVKQAKRKGVARSTLGLHYRATLYARPWRLIVIPMPEQPTDGGGRLDPIGNTWDAGAHITAGLIAQQLGSGRWAPLDTAAGHDRLNYIYEWRTP